MSAAPLLGKHALVCGASRGIGRATAMLLAERGASVTVLARNAQGLADLVTTLDRSHQQTHHALAADASDTATLDAAIRAHIAKAGTIHVLINNSGGPPAGAVHTATAEQFLAAFTQHLLANHTLMQATLSGMKEAGYGRIINVISTSVKIPLAGLGVSNTIRAAVASWAKTLAGEVAAHGITVNNVLPGATDTDRLAEIFAGKAAKSGQSLASIIEAETAHIPARRFGTPAELAAAIAFLASPEAAYINGINLPVDGGRTGCL